MWPSVGVKGKVLMVFQEDVQRRWRNEKKKWWLPVEGNGFLLGYLGGLWCVFFGQASRKGGRGSEKENDGSDSGCNTP